MLLKTRFLSAAFAQSSSSSEGAESIDGSAPPELESSPLYVTLRSSVAAPADSSGMAYSGRGWPSERS